MTVCLTPAFNPYLSLARARRGSRRGNTWAARGGGGAGGGSRRALIGVAAPRQVDPAALFELRGVPGPRSKARALRPERLLSYMGADAGFCNGLRSAKISIPRRPPTLYRVGAGWGGRERGGGEGGSADVVT